MPHSLHFIEIGKGQFAGTQVFLAYGLIYINMTHLCRGYGHLVAMRAAFFKYQLAHLLFPLKSSYQAIDVLSIEFFRKG